MGFKLKVILSVCGMLLTIFLLAYCLFNTEYYATMLTLSLILLFQVAALLRLVTTTNRQLSRFLQAVKYADFSQSFRNRGLDSSFTELGGAFDELIERFRSERSEKEAQAAYLHAFVEQIPIAVLALNEDGSIPVSNSALRRLIHRQKIDHLAQITDYSRALSDTFSKLQPGQERSLQITHDEDTLHLMLSCSILRSRGEQQKLISIQNIQGALDAKEIQAWQNLIRVMTHEIMNSITPITSLAGTSAQYLDEASQLLARSEYEGNDLQALLGDIGSAITTIGNRSQGLMRFVESYRSLTHLPMPKMRQFRLARLFASVTHLMSEQAKAHGVCILTSCHPETLELQADPELLEQALINLVRNAIEATGDVNNPQIELGAVLKDRGRVEISVTDNGSGIEAENLENIFIPFFSTKRGGSGIGMSIVKQIVKLNGGNVKVLSTPGLQTSVLISF